VDQSVIRNPSAVRRALTIGGGRLAKREACSGSRHFCQTESLETKDAVDRKEKKRMGKKR